MESTNHSHPIVISTVKLVRSRRRSDLKYLDLQIIRFSRIIFLSDRDSCLLPWKLI